jgi:urease accessory protein
MKFSINTDFTKLPRAGRVLGADEAAGQPVPFDVIVLQHDERHLRRRVLELQHGDKVLVDFLEPVMLHGRDRLVLDDGRQVEVIAGEEDLLEIRARDVVHLAEICWHIGNRHLAAQIEADRVLILHDHVIEAMLEGLGAQVTHVSEPFEPVRGAYSGHDHGHDHHGHDHDHDHDHDHHGHAHDHGHDHHHDHGHAHGERDRFGRMPGDPHYGHNHD